MSRRARSARREAVALLAAVTWGSGTGAASEGPLLDAKLTLPEALRAGGVACLSIAIENDGPAFDGTLVASVAGEPARAERAISAPPGFRGRLHLYFDPGPAPRALTLELRRASGTVVAAREIALQPIAEPRRVAAIVGTASWGLARFARDDERPLAVATIAPEAIPDRWYGWDGADVVVWPEASGEPPTVAARDALLDWVTMGGTLVVSTGGDGRILGSLGAKLPIAVAAGSAEPREAILRALGATGEATHAGTEQAPVSDLAASSSAARAVASLPSGRPLAMEARAGMGRVVVLAFDPDVAAPASAALSSTWQDLFPIPAIRRPGAGEVGLTDRAQASARRFVATIAPLRPLSPWTLAGFMAAYLFMVGPLDLVVLRKLRRRSLTWVTFPAVTVCFSAVAYAMAVASKGTGRIVSSLEIVDLARDHEARRLTSLTGIFVVEGATVAVAGPRAESLVLADPTRLDRVGAILGGAEPSTSRLGEGRLLLPIRVSTLERAIVRDAIGPDAGGPAPLSAELGDAWRGGWRDVVVHNASAAPIENVVAIGPGAAYVPLGRIGPGQSARVSDMGRAPMSIAATVGAGLSLPWDVESRSGRIESVSTTAVADLILAFTAPPPSRDTPDRAIGALSLEDHLDRGGYVVAGTTSPEGPLLSIDGVAPQGQALRVWRRSLDPPGS